MADCEHSWMCLGKKLVLDTILDDWLGPTLAFVHCTECRIPALLHLVSWSAPHLTKRIYAIRLVDQKIRDIYLDNINREYCDLSRKVSETEALIAASSQNARLVLVTSSAMIIEAYSKPLGSPAVKRWQDIETDTFDDWTKFLQT